MPPETDPTRQYSDREVRLILRSAAELQQRTDHADESGGMLIDALAARAHTMAAAVVPSAGGPNA